MEAEHRDREREQAEHDAFNRRNARFIKGDPVKIADTHRLFMELGIGMAEGRFVWPEIRNRAAARS